MKYLIWDFDGTLAFREGMWSGTLIELLEVETPGHGATIEQVRPFMRAGFPWHEPYKTREAGLHPDEWWKAMLPVFRRAFREGLNLDDALATRLSAMVRDAYLNPARWAVFDDTVSCLAALSAQGWRHVILSNHVPELRQIVEALGIASHFDAIFNSAETGIEKPHPEAFRQVRASLGELSEAWMIGDNVNADVAGAKAAGLPSVLVRNRDPGAEISFDDLRGVAEFFTASERTRPGRITA